MAKLGAYYGLCPLIDNKTLLGISEDSESGLIIVTLDKNIAIKYRISDQKQIDSWRTKEKFTSPVIYDQELSKYAAVFNQSYIRTWGDTDENLDKLKRYKFNKQIRTIFVCNKKSFIVFENGSIFSLNRALIEHKTILPNDTIDTKTEYIRDVLAESLNGEIYIGLIISAKNGENGKFCLKWTKFGVECQKFCTIQLERINQELRGQIFHLINNQIGLLTIWSDAKLFSIPLTYSDVTIKSCGDLFTVIDSLLCQQDVTMFALDENYIAMYGADCNEEGASLIIYNIQFKITQSKQGFKMFTVGAKLWRLDDKLLLTVGQNLAVVPFCLATEQLAALVGSHKAAEADVDPDICIVEDVEEANWNKAVINQSSILIPALLSAKIDCFLTQGLPESVILEKLCPKLIENQDLPCLLECINYFTDIPEKYLVDILKFLINVKNKSFKNQTLNKSEIYPNNLQPNERGNYIDLILNKPFSDVLILPHLRSEFDVNESLILLQYICYLLSDDERILPEMNFIDMEAKLIEWVAAILDSNYQKFLLTKDDKVVQILMSLVGIVSNELNSLDQFRDIIPLLNNLIKGKSVSKARTLNYLSYSVEKIKLY